MKHLLRRSAAIALLLTSAGLAGAIGFLAGRLSTFREGPSALQGQLTEAHTPDEKRAILRSPDAWNAMRFSSSEWLVFLSLITAPPLLMFFAYPRSNGSAVASVPSVTPAKTDGVLNWTFEPHDAADIPEMTAADHSFVIGSKRSSIRALFARDFGPLSFDVSMHHDRAEVTEYRGLIHWFRDVSEKLLAIALAIGFSLFLTRLLSYSYLYLAGEGWHLLLLPLDVNAAITLVGFALILDGLVIVSTMTDAPGIGRTMDAVIVILAGYVVMLVEAQPGEDALVSFTVGDPPWIAPLLSIVIALLFLVRWTVRHHTLRAWRGE